MLSRRGKSSKDAAASVVPPATPPGSQPGSRRNSLTPSEAHSITSHEVAPSHVGGAPGTLPPPLPLTLAPNNTALSTELKNDCAIKVVIRVRPLSEKELLARSPVVVNVSKSSIQVIHPELFTDPTYLDAISTPGRKASINNIPMALTTTALNAAQQAGECRTFHFDRCFGVDNAASNESEPYASAYDIDFSTQRPNQELIFEEIGKEIIPATFQGFNTTVLAYGQTGSGKTHTMVGERTIKTSGRSNKGGIIPRVCEALFHGIEARRAKEQQESEAAMEQNPLAGVKRTVYTVQMSYCEIYKEKVHDLLDGPPLATGSSGNGQPSPSSRDSFSSSSSSSYTAPDSPAHYRHGRTLKVREHPLTGPFVEGLSTRLVASYEEIAEEMAAGDKLRTVAATLMNATSSRSHAVFSITLTQTAFDVATQLTTAKTSKISMIDLAGSERANVSGTTGDRLKEGAMINKSLTTLGRVISALSKNSVERVPYRDSTLTWLLKESLGGNAKTTMIAMVSPAAENYDETMSTLRYAESAKKVINRAVINEDPNARVIRHLREEITQLRLQLSQRESEAFYLVENLKETAQLPPHVQVREEFYQQMQQEMNEYKTQLETITQRQENEQALRQKASKVVRLHEEYPSLVNERLGKATAAEAVTARDVLVFCLGEGVSVVGSMESLQPIALTELPRAEKVLEDGSGEAAPVSRSKSWSLLKRRKSMVDTNPVVDIVTNDSSQKDVFKRSKSMSPHKSSSFFRRKTSQLQIQQTNEEEINECKAEATEVVTSFLELRELQSFPGQILAKHAVVGVTKRLLPADRASDEEDEEGVEPYEPTDVGTAPRYEYVVEIQPFDDTAVVWVKGQRASTLERSRLSHGDIIAFGQAGIHRFRVHIPQVASVMAAKEDEAQVAAARKAANGLSVDESVRRAEALTALQTLVDEANGICAHWDLPMSFSVPISTGPSLEEEEPIDKSVVVIMKARGVDKHGEPRVKTQSWTKEHLAEQLAVWKQMTSSLEATMAQQAQEQAEFAAQLLQKQERMRIRLIEEQEKEALARQADLAQEKAKEVQVQPTPVTPAVILADVMDPPSPHPQYIRLLGQSRVALSGLMATSSVPESEDGDKGKALAPRAMSAAVYDASGQQIARMLCTLTVLSTTVNTSTSAKGRPLPPLRRGLSQLTSPRSRQDDTVPSADEATGSKQWNVQVMIDRVEVVESVMASQYISLTIKKWKATAVASSTSANSAERPAIVESTPKIALDKATYSYPLQYQFITTTTMTPFDDSLAFEVWGYGDMVPAKTSLQPTVSMPMNQHEFFVSVDMEDRENDGLFRPVAVKSDGTLRLHVNQPRRVNVRITQADPLPFILQDIALVQLSPATLERGAANLSVASGKVTQQLVFPSLSGCCSTSSTALEAATMDLDHLPVFHEWSRLIPRGEAEMDVTGRSLSISLRWEPGHRGTEGGSGQSEEGVEPFATEGEQVHEEADPEDARSVFRIAVSFQTTLSSIPIVLSKSIVTKRSTTLLTNAQRLAREWKNTKTAWWARESFSRSYRLGTWYTVDIVPFDDPTLFKDKPEGDSTEREGAQPIVSPLAQQAVQEHINGLRRLELVFAMERVRQEIVLRHWNSSSNGDETQTGAPLELTMEHAQECFERILNHKSDEVVEGQEAQETESVRLAPVMRVVQLEEGGVPYLRHKASRDVFVAIESGTILDTSKAARVEKQGEEELLSVITKPKHITHFVSEPTHLGGDNTSEMCGFLMFSTSVPLDETASGTAAAVTPMDAIDSNKPPQSRNLWTHAREAIHNRLSWDRRWLVLKRPFLYVYKTFAKKEQVGVLDISKCQLVVPAAGSNPSGKGENTNGPTRRRSSFFNTPINSSSLSSSHSAPLGFQLVSMVGAKCVVWSLQASATAEMRAWLVAIDPLKIQAREAVVSNANAVQASSNNNTTVTEGTVITA